MQKLQFHNYTYTMTEHDINKVQALDYEYRQRKINLQYIKDNSIDIPQDTLNIYRIDCIAFGLELEKLVEEMITKYAGKNYDSRFIITPLIDFTKKTISWRERNFINETETN